MTQPIHQALPGAVSPGTTGPTDRTGPTGRATPATGRERASGTPSVAFEVLLERLEQQSAVLAREAQQVDGPQDLHRAVDGARSALEAALTIQERLLEAAQQARRQSGLS